MWAVVIKTYGLTPLMYKNFLETITMSTEKWAKDTKDTQKC